MSSGGPPDNYHMKFGNNAGASVDAYLEYKRIVGDDDGGVMFTDEQYEDYKKRVLPERMKNRLFVSWTSPTGMDCKLIGPETPCFCGHRFKQHQTDFAHPPEERPIQLPCKQKGCKCISYNYVPLNGGQPIRCSCKHPADSHSAMKPYKCKNVKAGCKCTGFKSSFTCACMKYTYEHETLVETKEERLAKGKPVGHDTPYQAMGGLTGFSSLAEGYQRLDPSGIGAPSAEFLAQPVSASDHPFLRANLPAMNSYRAMEQGTPEYEADLAEQMQAMRRPGETDMDYFERRYQQRQKAERTAKRAITPGRGRGSTTRGGANSSRGGARAKPT
ncbi:protein FAM221A-like [Watersipora subatra]|uniref:protein FAM221A-like n=1 Tax=Watersipora subatra TaxID=2589382 RepID=UPI00355BAF09